MMSVLTFSPSTHVTIGWTIKVDFNKVCERLLPPPPTHVPIGRQIRSVNATANLVEVQWWFLKLFCSLFNYVIRTRRSYGVCCNFGAREKRKEEEEKEVVGTVIG